MAGLADKPGPDLPKYTSETGRRILAILEREPPGGFARWNRPLIAAELGDVHEQRVWRFLRAQKIDLAGRKSWCESNDPQFIAKAADVVGLSMAPPEECDRHLRRRKAFDPGAGACPRLSEAAERPGADRPQPRLQAQWHHHAVRRLRGGHRQGRAAHKTRRRRIEFLDFMNDIVVGHPDTAIHVVLDNLNTHKPKNDRWLKRHRTCFHFTPTRASWLNQVEIWFSILEGQSLHGASFTSVAQQGAYRCFHRRLQRKRSAVRLDQSQGPSAPRQGTPYQ
ncbi:MAG: IS630 family transposase [Xanthobacteraceae bacterium]